jgi:transposase
VELNKIVMKQMYFIGVDISKSKIDCALMNSDLKLVMEKEVMNTDQKIFSFLKLVFKRLRVDATEILVCCENTGIYNRPLERVCVSLGIKLWVEHALKIKRASTDMRGKNDRKDAIRIAEYAIRYQDKMVLYQEPSMEMKELDSLVKVRETLLAQRVAIDNQLRESKSHDKEEFKVMERSYRNMLKTLNKTISQTEERINALIEHDKQLSQNVTLMMSIPGIGMQCAINFVLATNNFKNFNSAKHLACYAGVVPFQNQSGTIVKRERISKMANRNLKRLLHLSAMAAVRFDEQTRSYYVRKVTEGKNKMSVLNAVRNKLVHRIMAVITRQTPYEPALICSIKKEQLLLDS